MDDYGVPLCNVLGDVQFYQTEERADAALATYNDDIQSSHHVSCVSLSYVNPLSQ
jgi:hypothetical protein